MKNLNKITLELDMRYKEALIKHIKLWQRKGT